MNKLPPKESKKSRKGLCKERRKRLNGGRAARALPFAFFAGLRFCFGATRFLRGADGSAQREWMCARAGKTHRRVFAGSRFALVVHAPRLLGRRGLRRYLAPPHDRLLLLAGGSGTPARSAPSAARPLLPLRETARRRLRRCRFRAASLACFCFCAQLSEQRHLRARHLRRLGRPARATCPSRPARARRSASVRT